MTQDNEIDHGRYYLCDNGESEDAFLVCGECLSENEREPSLYDELPPLPQASIDEGYTRTCVVCDRTPEELSATSD